jgi:dethiobiotin synthetase
MNSAMTSRSLFITGTDTNVGKTAIMAALILALQQEGQSVGVLKPLETGVGAECREDSDTDRLRRLLSPPPSFDSVCLYALPQPLAPQAAARQTGTTIDLSRIRTHMHELAQRYPFLLIEGAGGIFTPLTSQHTMRDLIRLLNVPCLIVGGTQLGGVNHCLLTLEALQQAGIRLYGIVLNESDSKNQTAITRQQQETTVELIREWSSVPVFGPIGFTHMIATNWQEGIKQLAKHPEIQRLATHLNEMGPEIG